MACLMARVRHSCNDDVFLWPRNGNHLMTRINVCCTLYTRSREDTNLEQSRSLPTFTHAMSHKRTRTHNSEGEQGAQSELRIKISIYTQHPSSVITSCHKICLPKRLLLFLLRAIHAQIVSWSSFVHISYFM